MTAIQIAYHLFPACPAWLHPTCVRSEAFTRPVVRVAGWKVSLIRSLWLNKHTLLVCMVLLFIINFRTAAIFHTFDNKNNPCMCLILNSDNEISSAKNVNDNYFLIHWEMATLTYSPQSCMWVGRVVMITMNFTWKKKNFLVAVLLLLYYMLVILKHRHHNSQVESARGKYVQPTAISQNTLMQYQIPRTADIQQKNNEYQFW